MHEFIVVADVFPSIPSAISSSSAFSTAPTETRADPLQHIKFYISQLFFFFSYRQCWAQGILSTYLFLSGCSFLFRICSLHARPCLLPPEVKVPPSRSYLLCMCSISIDSPFYAKSAVNTRQVARLVLFMNMCPWRHPLSSVFFLFFFSQSPGVGSGRGVLDRIPNCFYREPMWFKHISSYGTQRICALRQNYTTSHISAVDDGKNSAVQTVHISH